MSESVEQAARVAGWKARAEREAAAILDQSPVAGYLDGRWPRERIIGLLSIAWIQGVEFGMHDALGEVDTAFENMRAAL